MKIERVRPQDAYGQVLEGQLPTEERRKLIKRSVMTKIILMPKSLCCFSSCMRSAVLIGHSLLISFCCLFLIRLMKRAKKSRPRGFTGFKPPRNPSSYNLYMQNIQQHENGHKPKVTEVASNNGL